MCWSRRRPNWRWPSINQGCEFKDCFKSQDCVQVQDDYLRWPSNHHLYFQCWIFQEINRWMSRALWLLFLRSLLGNCVLNTTSKCLWSWLEWIWIESEGPVSVGYFIFTSAAIMRLSSQEWNEFVRWVFGDSIQINTTPMLSWYNDTTTVVSKRVWSLKIRNTVPALIEVTTRFETPPDW